MSIYSHDPSGNHGTSENKPIWYKLIVWLATIFSAKPTPEKIQKIWNDKKDDQILYAYHDAIGWIDLSEKSHINTIHKIAKSCQHRLDKHIIPQMVKRKLKGYSPALIEAFMDDFVNKHTK